MGEKQEGNQISRRALLAFAAAMGIAPPLLEQMAAFAATRYKFPFDVHWWIPDDGEFGNNASWRSQKHAGVDFNTANMRGMPIQCISDGQVWAKSTSASGQLGYWLKIRHDDGAWSTSAHMIAESPLSVGSRVGIGQEIGRVGNSGYIPGVTIGTHLHLSMALAESGMTTFENSFDPIQYINARLNSGSSPGTPAQGEDMQIIKIISDNGPTNGSEYGSTAYITSMTGWVRASTGLGPRDELDAVMAVAGALGFEIIEKHVNNDGFILSQKFVAR